MVKSCNGGVSERGHLSRYTCVHQSITISLLPLLELLFAQNQSRSHPKVSMRLQQRNHCPFSSLLSDVSRTKKSSPQLYNKDRQQVGVPDVLLDQPKCTPSTLAFVDAVKLARTAIWFVFNYTTMPLLWLFLFPNVSSFEMSSTLFSSDWPFGIDLPLKSAYDRLRLRANKNSIIIIISCFFYDTKLRVPTKINCSLSLRHCYERYDR